VTIYVCEYGCRYEGGAVLIATTNYLKAWKALRAKRLEDEKKAHRSLYPNETRLIDKDYWSGEYYYYAIRRFEDD